jgi:GxxExxY protein
MTVLLHKELTGAIIGAYYEVYNHTSRMLPEYIYERALMEELRRRGCPVICQDEYQIFYKEYLVGVQRLDLFVVREIVVENKVADRLTPLHKAQTFSYLKTVGKNVGLLFNFRGKGPEFERLHFDRTRQENPGNDPVLPTPMGSWLYPDLAYNVVGGLYEVHSGLGPGFIHRIYANACNKELKLRGLEVSAGKRIQVAYKDVVVGEVAFGHLLVEGKIMVFPIATTDFHTTYLETLKEWMRMCHIRLGILAHFNTIRLEITFVIV